MSLTQEATVQTRGCEKHAHRCCGGGGGEGGGGGVGGGGGGQTSAPAQKYLGPVLVRDLNCHGYSALAQYHATHSNHCYVQRQLIHSTHLKFTPSTFIGKVSNKRDKYNREFLAT